MRAYFYFARIILLTIEEYYGKILIVKIYPQGELIC